MKVMNRRLALTFAGATAIFVTAASGAVAANVGLLNVGSAKPVGKLTAANVSQLATPSAVRADSVTPTAGAADQSGAATPSAPAGATNTSTGAGAAASSPSGSSNGSSSLNVSGLTGGSGSGASAPSGSPSTGTPTTTQVVPAPTTTLTTSPPTTSRSQHESEPGDDHERVGEDD